MYFGMRAPRMTRPNNTTAYTNGDLVANNATAGSVVPLVFGEALAGGPLLLHRAIMLSSNNTVTNKNYRLFLFSESPTVTNGDGGALAVTAANAAALVGILGSTAAIATGAGSFQVFTPLDSAGTSLRHWPMSMVGRVWGLLQAHAAYTPTANETFDVTLEVGYPNAGSL